MSAKSASGTLIVNVFTGGTVTNLPEWQPNEKTDLADAEPKRIAELRARMEELRKDDVTRVPDDLKGLAK